MSRNNSAFRNVVDDHFSVCIDLGRDGQLARVDDGNGCGFRALKRVFSVKQKGVFVCLLSNHVDGKMS